MRNSQIRRGMRLLDDGFIIRKKDTQEEILPSGEGKRCQRCWDIGWNFWSREHRRRRRERKGCGFVKHEGSPQLHHKDTRLINSNGKLARSGAEYFATRTFHGLDMYHDSSSPVEPFLIGRRGKASGYQYESNNTDNRSELLHLLSTFIFDRRS